MPLVALLPLSAGSEREQICGEDMRCDNSYARCDSPPASRSSTRGYLIVRDTACVDSRPRLYQDEGNALPWFEPTATRERS